MVPSMEKQCLVVNFPCQDRWQFSKGFYDFFFKKSDPAPNCRLVVVISDLGVVSYIKVIKRL